jgi:hypothetical protein
MENRGMAWNMQNRKWLGNMRNLGIAWKYGKLMLIPITIGKVQVL